MTTRVTSNDLKTLPWRMLPLAKDYVRMANAEGKEAAAIARSALMSLGEDLAQENLERWEEVKPAHYEAWLRRREAIVAVGSPEAKAEFANQHFRAQELFDMIEERGLRTDSPADSYRVKQDGTVMKFGDANPALDQPIADYIKQSGLEGTPAGNVQRCCLRALGGALLARGVRQWRDVTTAHVELIARDWVAQAKAAGKPSAATIQNRIRTARSFFDAQVENGTVASNPAENVATTKRGRVTTVRDMNPAMFEQAKAFVADQTENTETTKTAMNSVATRLTIFVCGECGVHNWDEVTPEHYEEFLRSAWGRNYRHPANAMFQQSTTKKLMSHLVEKGLAKRDPSEGIRFTMNGELHAPDHKPVILPEQYALATKETVAQSELPEGFRDEVRNFLKQTEASRKVGTLMRARQTLPEVAAFSQQKGAKNWQDVTREDMAEYGRDIYARLSPNTAVNKFSAARLFFADLHERGHITGNPVYGAQMIAARGLETPAAPSREMEHQIDLYTKKLPTQARAAQWRELFEIGAELAKTGKSTWAEATPEALARALQNVTVTYSAGERNASLKANRAFFDTLLENGKVETNPAKNLVPAMVWRLPGRQAESLKQYGEESTQMLLSLKVPSVSEKAVGPAAKRVYPAILDSGLD